jgi:hypothetical protein
MSETNDSDENIPDWKRALKQLTDEQEEAERAARRRKNSGTGGKPPRATKAPRTRTSVSNTGAAPAASKRPGATNTPVASRAVGTPLARGTPKIQRKSSAVSKAPSDSQADDAPVETSAQERSPRTQTTSERTHAELLAFRVQQRLFPPSHPFYCLRCAMALSEKLGWRDRPRGDEKRAVPVIRTRDGVVRQVAIGVSSEFSFSVEWKIQDAQIRDDETMQIIMSMWQFGMRLVPSLPAVVSGRVRCGHCRVRLLDVDGLPLGDV